MLFSLAWKNIWRNRTRSLVVMCSITLGLWAGSFIMAFYYGMMEQRVDSVIRSELSHVQIHHPKFKDDFLIKFAVENAENVIAQIRKIPEVKTVSGRIVTAGMFGTASGNSGVMIHGVDAKDETDIIGINKNIREGNFFAENKKNPIVIGEKLAQKLKVGVKSKIVLSFQDKNGEIVSAAFRVQGIFKTANSKIDETKVFVLKKNLADLLQIENSVHEIAVLLNSHEDLAKVTPIIRLQNPNLTTQTWLELEPMMKYMTDMMDQTMLIFMFIIFLALMFGIINAMLMAVLERYRELGILTAIGMNRRKIFFMIVLETLYLSLFGVPFGLVAGIFTNWHFGQTGIDLSIFSEGLAQFGYDTMIYPRLKPYYYWQIAWQIFSIGLLSAIYPALKALKLKPLEAIRKI